MIELSFSHKKVLVAFSAKVSLFIFRQPVWVGVILAKTVHFVIILHLSPRIARQNVCERCAHAFPLEGVHLSVGGSIRPKDKLT